MNIGIVGCGAYGLALASILNENKCNVVMWTKFKEEKELLDKERCDNKKLNGYKIPKEIKFTNDMKDVVCGMDLIIIAIPAAFIEDSIKELSEYYKNEPICIASKGIQKASGLFLSDILKKYISIKNLAVISGPSFAIDIVNKVPIGLSLASKNKSVANLVKDCLQNNYIKIRITNDITGVELCGAIKNVIAIAAGMLDGMNLPESTKAMFITESLHDIMSLISALGGNERTILSYAGFGDLLLTCTSVKSRNFSFGRLIGSKASKEEIEKYKNETTIEGLYTLDSVYKLTNMKHIKIPIINLIYDIIFNNVDCQKLLEFLIEKE